MEWGFEKMKKTILSFESVSKNFGGLAALTDVSLSVTEGDVISLIGPNGAGKTTLLNIATNLLPLSSGKVIFEDERTDHLPPYRIPGRGIARTFQILKLPLKLSVLENVAIGAHSRSESGVFPIVLRLSRMRSEEMQIMEKAKEAIRFVGLEDHMNAITGILPLGTQRLVEMARALMCEPKLLFLDEVTTGLNFHEKQKVIHVLQKIREQGTTIFIVAHDMSFVMELSSKIYVLNFGKKIAEGSPEEIRKNREVIDVYLGRTETNS
jgi:branched-chain amino acid transport system ATP-binding protein